MSEQEKGGAPAFIAGIEVSVDAEVSAEREHFDASEAKAHELAEQFIEWSKTQPFIAGLPGDLNGNALGDFAGAILIALANVTAKQEPYERAALVCSQQFTELFFAAYMSAIQRASL